MMQILKVPYRQKHSVNKKAMLIKTIFHAILKDRPELVKLERSEKKYSVKRSISQNIIVL